MIPYIIINGENSKNITGLLIQSLPPITKPKIRTSIEEIDGRDGDTVTELGYSAYDKTFSVGLRGDYNVDDVINYFATSGKITFSNEPDKYYNFAVYNQIDFNKLLRFKTANVTLHVQPFKYSAEETKKEYTDAVNIQITNAGNVKSRPVMEITGDGIITVDLNYKHILTLELNNETIKIDSEEMNAYINGAYANRQVSGNYDELALNAGANTLLISGDVSKVTFDKYSRWI